MSLKTQGDPVHPLFGPLESNKRTISHASVSIISQSIRFVLQLSATIILSRLLTASDFGLVAMVSILINFASVFKDAGLTHATVQRSSISQEQISTLFWINIGISTLVALSIVACAPLIAWFFEDERLTLLCICLALPIAVSGLGMQHRALLQRNMKFGHLAIVDVVGLGIGTVAGIFFARMGYGYWSLALMQIFSATSTAVLLWIVGKWLPSGIYRQSGVKGMLRFGAELSGFNFLNYFTRNADDFLIGKFVGTDDLGYYSRAYSILLTPISQISSPLSMVYLPVLSRLTKQPENFRKTYLGLIRWVNMGTAPAAVLLSIHGEEIVAFLLGPKWVETGQILSVLAITAMFQPLGSFCGMLLTSLGQTRRILKWGFFSSFLIVSSFIFGLQYGAIGVAAFYTLAIAVQQPILTWYTLRYSPVSITQYIRALGPGIALALVLLALDLFY